MGVRRGGRPGARRAPAPIRRFHRDRLDKPKPHGRMGWRLSLSVFFFFFFLGRFSLWPPIGEHRVPRLLWEPHRKHCYGEMGRHTGLRGLGPAGRLGSNPSSNNFLPILFSKPFETNGTERSEFGVKYRDLGAHPLRWTDVPRLGRTRQGREAATPALPGSRGTAAPPRAGERLLYR